MDLLYLGKAFVVGAIILVVIFGIIVIGGLLFYAGDESDNPFINSFTRFVAYFLLVLFLILAAIGAGDKWLNR